MQSEKEIIEEIELAKLAWRDRQHSDCANWLHKARPMPKEHFKKEVRDGSRGDGKRDPGRFKLYQSQMPVIERVIDRNGGCDAGK
jgi:hypothetical protein